MARRQNLLDQINRRIRIQSAIRGGIGALSGAIIGRATGRGPVTTTLLSLGGGIAGTFAPDIVALISGPPKRKSLSLLNPFNL